MCFISPEAVSRGITGKPGLAHKKRERAETWQHQFPLAQAGKEQHPQAIQLVRKWNFARTEMNISKVNFHS